METVIRADDLAKPPEIPGFNSTVNKENEHIHNAATPIPIDTTQPNADTERSQAAPEAQNLSVKVLHDSPAATVPDATNAQMPGTEPVADISTKGKTPKTEVGGRNRLPTDHQQKQRPRVYHSLSFPAKGIFASGMSKSATDIKVTKTAAPKTSRSNGNSAKQPKLSSATATRQSKIVKSTPSIVNNGGHSPSMPRDTTCVITQHKSGTPVFASRLDERAEKRKEFFLKLEEKIHAKEMEKTDQQAKSKEDQEAEIKKLRKSLTFKATPMPSFYKEPGPPKTELKKIPTTRPISPKLGRHKPSAITIDSPPQGDGLRSDLDASNSNGDATHVARGSADRKKPVRKYLSKIASPKSTSSKTERKTPGTKAEVTEAEEKDRSAKAVEMNTEDGEERPTEAGETDACSSVANADEKDQSKIDLAAPAATPIEVSIGG